MYLPRLTGALLALFIGGCAGTQAMATPVAPSTQAEAQPAASVHATVVAAAGATPRIDRDWANFRDVRDGWIAELGATLTACTTAEGAASHPECVRRSETFEVGFALTRMYAATHDPAYLDAAAASVSAKQLAKPERFDLYTATWFLAMVTEHERLKRHSELHSTAKTVAAALETSLTSLDDYRFAQGAMFGNEDNVALALKSLWAWSKQSGDTELAGRLDKLTKSRFLGPEMDSWCPMPIDGEPDNSEFLPPCLQRAVTVLAVAPGEVSNPWLAGFLAQQTSLEPVVAARLATHGTLNFSRAVALWSVYEATGDAAYRRMYVRHVNAQMNQIHEVVRTGGEIDPWQAAFGAYALSLSVDS